MQDKYMLHMSIERIKKYVLGNQVAVGFRIGYHHVKVTVAQKRKS